MRYHTIFKFILGGIFAFCLSAASDAQSFAYQAALRHDNGDLIANDVLDIRFSILDANSLRVYEEVHHNIRTTDLGLLNVAIGEGISNDYLSDIDWTDGAYSLQVEIDIDQNGSFTNLGQERIRMVPLAIQALNQTVFTAGNGISINGDVIQNTGDLDGNDDVNKTTLFNGDVRGTYNSNYLVDGSVKSDIIANGAVEPRHLSTNGLFEGDGLIYKNGQWERDGNIIREILPGNKIFVAVTPGQATIFANVPSMLCASIDRDANVSYSYKNNTDTFKAVLVDTSGAPYYKITWGALNPTNSAITVTPQYANVFASVNYDTNNSIKVYIIDTMTNQPSKGSFSIQIIKN